MKYKSHGDSGSEAGSDKWMKAVNLENKELGCHGEEVVEFFRGEMKDGSLDVQTH